MIKRLKGSIIRDIDKQLKDFCEMIAGSTDEYAFYRGRVYNNEEGHLIVEFLASDIKGRFKVPTITYTVVNGEPALFYDDKANFKFKSEKVVVDAIKKLITCISSVPQSVERVIFDFNDYANLSDALLLPDEEPNTYILFLQTKARHEDSYGMAAAAPYCSEELCCDVRPYLTEIVKQRRAFKEENPGISKWYDEKK